MPASNFNVEQYTAAIAVVRRSALTVGARTALKTARRLRVEWDNPAIATVSRPVDSAFAKKRRSRHLTAVAKTVEQAKQGRVAAIARVVDLAQQGDSEAQRGLFDVLPLLTRLSVDLLSVVPCGRSSSRPASVLGHLAILGAILALAEPPPAR